MSWDWLIQSISGFALASLVSASSLVLKERHVGLGARVQGHFHHLLTLKGTEGKKYLTEMTQPLPAQPLSLSCVLYFKAMKGICLYSNVYRGTWMQVDIVFVGTTGRGRREGSNSASRLFLCKPRSSMCAKESTWAVWAVSPKAVGCSPRWNEVKDVLKCFLHCNLNMERGDWPEVWKCRPWLPKHL